MSDRENRLRLVASMTLNVLFLFDSWMQIRIIRRRDHEMKVRLVDQEGLV